MKERNGLAYFTSAVNQLMECKLILVDKHIAIVLKCVTEVPALTKCLSDTLKTSNYVTEFSRARVTWTKNDGTVEAKLKLPVDKNRLFAFVVCLLAEVDSGRHNFIEFLKEYFYDADSNVSYEMFVNDVLKPFKRAGENILRTVDPDSLDLEAQDRAEKFFFAQKAYFNSESLRYVLGLVESIRGLLERETFADETERIDAVTICNAMTNALQLKNPKILRFIWIGFKYTMRNYPSTSEIVAIIGATLEKEGIA